MAARETDPSISTDADRRVSGETASSILTIDLDALKRNYAFLRHASGTAETAAVVKADAYGLGIERVGPALWRAGCRRFFVATPAEGVTLRRLLPDAVIFVFDGPTGQPGLLALHRLVPVLNTFDDIAAWEPWARTGPPQGPGGRKNGTTLPAAVHVDTGMNRLGLPVAGFRELIRDPARLDRLNICLVISHLACADEPANPKNHDQQALFARLVGETPGLPACLANSGGVLMGAPFHFDLTRPGIALYGGVPALDRPENGFAELAQVVHLKARILQIREIDSPETVGYGAAFRAEGAMKIATVAVGYGDGYPRALSHRGSALVNGIRVPLVGRVSMDLSTFDVSAVPPHACRPGDFVDLISPAHTVDDLADEAGTIAYEILTSLGRRHTRVYVEETR